MLEILYEDNHLIVCYKPKGILSQSDGSPKANMLDMVKAYIKEKYRKPGNVYVGLVHRLDTNTSGIMVFAKTSKAAARLSESIRTHRMTKRYIATVEGTLENSDFIELRNFITKDEDLKKSRITESGQEAVLLYRALSRHTVCGVAVTDVDIELKTGRYHQIRVQFAHIGHPLYGDVKYGSRYRSSDNTFFLQAYALSFPHPTTKEIMNFEKKVDTHSL